MDILLQKVTQQAMNYAIRSGVVITSSYALNQCSRLVKNVKPEERDELNRLQRRLESKMRIIAPAIDMIELIAARGNTSLESAVSLTKSIRWSIQSLGVRLAKAATDEERAKRGSSRSKSSEQLTSEIKIIVRDIKDLLEQIEDAVPLINLAITTSGVSLSTNLPPAVSPSRLLQASTFLSASDSQYSINPGVPCQAGPRFTTSMYMLFLGHANQALDEEGLEKVVWQEVIHKAQIKVVRVPINKVNKFPFSEADSEAFRGNEDGEERIPGEAPSFEYAYQLTIIEDTDDDRVHTFEDNETQPSHVDDVAAAGIRTHIPIHQVARIFYADTGKILNLGSEGEMNNPILLLRRDVNAPAPRRMMQYDAPADVLGGETHLGDNKQESDFLRVKGSMKPGAQSSCANGTPNVWTLPPGLDPEWIALEVFQDGFDSDDESDAESGTVSPSPAPQETHVRQQRTSLASAFSDLRLASSSRDQSTASQPRDGTTSASNLAYQHQPTLSVNRPVTASLSLLEMLIRLTSLQQFQQSSHLAITDEFLNFFLSEASTTGAASGDADARKRIRMEARQHVGFDPYDESPIKPRGEAQQHNLNGEARKAPIFDDSPVSSRTQSPLSYNSNVSPSHRTVSRRANPVRRSSGTRSTPLIPGTRPTSEPPLPMTPLGIGRLRDDLARKERASTTSPGHASSPLAQYEPMTSHFPTSSPDT